ncbi:hypothetical protein BH18THE1_BH18THE1_00860 [soil metagenome]
MVKTQTSAITIATIGILSVLFVGAASLTSHIMAAQAQDKFTAKLSGKDEVPPNQSPSTGFAWVKTTNDQIGYEVNVTDIDKVTAAHIHFGESGKNGPVILTLFKGGPTEQTNGTLGEANVTASNLEGPMKGKGIPDLVAAMKNGTTYVNVHSTDFPDGEMRGQLQANSTS